MMGGVWSNTVVSETIEEARNLVRTAYRLLLDREPENEAVVDAHLSAEGGGTNRAVRNRLLLSDEFQALYYGMLPTRGEKMEVEAALLDSNPVARAGCFTDRFGVLTRVSYLPDDYGKYAGRIGSADGTFDMPLHEKDELTALLRSVASASVEFVAAELGAGWGPWIVLGGQLARRRGLSVKLMAVEGSHDHVAFIHTHMADNGFDPGDHLVLHAVAGSQDGVARFPRLKDPSKEWGAAASYATDEVQEMDEVASLSLPTLLGRMPVLDFLHCDVQGAEADLVESGMAALNDRVRRACIGTHGRAIEEKLHMLFAGQDWVLEADLPCRFDQHGRSVVLAADGVQVWRNPRL